MDFWKRTKVLLADQDAGVLLCVVESIGSSPGRAGFRMFVTRNEMTGSIGGGIMEHKLATFAQSLLDTSPFIPFLRRQIHQGKIGENRSGMICSGEQTVAFCLLDRADLSWLSELISAEEGRLTLDARGVHFSPENTREHRIVLENKGSESWTYHEWIGAAGTVYIIGGGHVGLACSEILQNLGFRIILLDHRENLNTFLQNPYAHERKVIDFDEVRRHVQPGTHSYVVLVSFGYRTDAQVMRNLAGLRFRYFGVMGSAEKMNTLLAELREEGYDEAWLGNLKTPIGMQIYSKTPEEIAVSIAAEIIRTKNEPTE